MEYKYLVSIIIPHYNSPDLLKKLLSTIPDQESIQTIVIDDHSADEVKVQLKDLQVTYAESNISFLENNTEEHNAGAARNIGLKHAEGKWLLFADADDYFLDGFYNTIKKQFNSDSDIVYFLPTSIKLDTGEADTRTIKITQRLYDYLENPCMETEVHLRYLWPYPWSKLVRNSMVQEHNITFESIRYSNDDMFSAQVGFYAKKISASEEIIYCATRSVGSLTTYRDRDALEVRAQQKIRRFQFLKTHLNKEEFRASDAYKIAPLQLLNIIRRKNGIRCFFKYVKLFRKNKMLIQDIRVFNPKNLRGAMRGNASERELKTYELPKSK